MTFTRLEKNENAKISIIGVGGAGRNAIENMIQAGLTGVEFIYADTNKGALEHSEASLKIQIGEKLTAGLGAGATPSVGRAAAEESLEEIKKAIPNSHMCFITAGFGGGTGTGAAPVIARLCREMGALTICVVSKPFSFEGRKKSQVAEAGINRLQEIAHTVVTIPNDRLRSISSKEARAVEVFRKADEILHHSIQGITDLIKVKGLVNLDFADVRSIMENSGQAMIGFGTSCGANRGVEAIEQAISHPLLEDLPLSGAQGALVNITSDSSITMEEMTKAMDRLYGEVGENADIFWGQTINEDLEDAIQVTLIVTGIKATMVEAP